MLTEIVYRTWPNIFRNCSFIYCSDTLLILWLIIKFSSSLLLAEGSGAVELGVHCPPAATCRTTSGVFCPIILKNIYFRVQNLSKAYKIVKNPLQNKKIYVLLADLGRVEVTPQWRTVTRRMLVNVGFELQCTEFELRWPYRNLHGRLYLRKRN